MDKKIWPKLRNSFSVPFVLRFLWPSKNISNQILLYIFVLDTLLFLTKKTPSLYDIVSQSYIENKINAKLLHHPLSTMDIFLQNTVEYNFLFKYLLIKKEIQFMSSDWISWLMFLAVGYLVFSGEKMRLTSDFLKRSKYSSFIRSYKMLGYRSQNKFKYLYCLRRKWRKKYYLKEVHCTKIGYFYRN